MPTVLSRNPHNYRNAAASDPLRCAGKSGVGGCSSNKGAPLLGAYCDLAFSPTAFPTCIYIQYKYINKSEQSRRETGEFFQDLPRGWSDFKMILSIPMLHFSVQTPRLPPSPTAAIPGIAKPPAFWSVAACHPIVPAQFSPSLKNFAKSSGPRQARAPVCIPACGASQGPGAELSVEELSRAVAPLPVAERQLSGDKDVWWPLLVTAL